VSSAIYLVANPARRFCPASKQLLEPDADQGLAVSAAHGRIELEPGAKQKNGGMKNMPPFLGEGRGDQASAG